MNFVDPNNDHLKNFNKEYIKKNVCQNNYGQLLI